MSFKAIINGEVFKYRDYAEQYFKIKLGQGYTNITMQQEDIFKDIKLGDSGEAVKKLQQELNEHFDAKLKEDGEFGYKTQAAVKVVEGLLGLPQDGIADADVMRMLWDAKGLWKDITPEDIEPTPATDGWIPFAKKYKTMKTRGRYRNGWPEGFVVHFNAGRDGVGTIDHGIKMGYTYLVLTRDGTLYQACPINEWGYHAGSSAWPSVGSGVSQYFGGVEISSAGKCDPINVDGVTKYKAWFHTDPKEYFDESEMRYSDGKDEKFKGWYQKYTPAQEETLVKLLHWLWKNSNGVFELENIVGHDTVAVPKGRKNDPGAALSCTLEELREKVKSWKNV